MADLPQSAVTKGDIFYEGGINSRRFKAIDVTLVLTGQGSAANKIPASLFGLTRITRALSFRATDDSIILDAAPSNDGSKLLLKAAGTNAPADYTATIKGVVEGIE